MSKIAEVLDSIGLIVIVLLIARVINWLLSGFIASWSSIAQIGLSITIAIILVFLGLVLAYNSQDNEGN